MHDNEDLLSVTTETASFEIEVVEREDPAAVVFDEVEVRGYGFPRRTGRVFSRVR